MGEDGINMGDFIEAYENDEHSLAETGKEICPICGYMCSHITEVKQGDFIGKQGAIAIKFDGECGHSWVRIIDSHKGEIFNALVIHIQARFKVINQEIKGEILS